MPEIEEELLDMAARGCTLRKIREHIGFGEWKFTNYREKYPIFNQQLTRARESGADEQLDSIVEMVDLELDPNVARVKIDALKWKLSRGFPHKFGDRIDLNINQKIDLAGVLEAAERRVSPLLVNGDTEDPDDDSNL